MSMTAKGKPQIEQLTFLGPTCHVKGCTKPVVGSSIATRDGHVCKHHNEIEWATALSRGKDGYWRMFGKRWLEEIRGTV